MWLEGSSAVVGQLRAPDELGHSYTALPDTGSRAGLVVFLPVLGSIAVIRFCRPRSLENRYCPVARSITSKMASLPAVSTTSVSYTQLTLPTRDLVKISV